MADARARDLQRGWQLSRSASDGLALLSHLRRVEGNEVRALRRAVETGLLSLRQLELCAFLQHEPAQEALEGLERILFTLSELGDMFSMSPSGIRAWQAHGCPLVRRGRRLYADPSEVFAWRRTNELWRLPIELLITGALVQGCAVWDAQAGLRALLAVVRTLCSGAEDDPALSVLERWVQRPTSVALRSALGDRRSLAQAAARALEELAGSTLDPTELRRATQRAQPAAGQEFLVLVDAVGRERALLRVWEAARDEVVPWVLFEDPLPLVREPAGSKSTAAKARSLRALRSPPPAEGQAKLRGLKEDDQPGDA